MAADMAKELRPHNVAAVLICRMTLARELRRPPLFSGPRGLGQRGKVSTRAFGIEPHLYASESMMDTFQAER